MALQRLAALLGVLLIAGCGSTPPPTSLAVGAGPDSAATLLAHLYAAALRSYGLSLIHI